MTKSFPVFIVGVRPRCSQRPLIFGSDRAGINVVGTARRLQDNCFVQYSRK